MISYKKQSLFDAPSGSYLVHACNSRGVWGAGIALEFRNKFPHSFYVYNMACNQNPRILGKNVLVLDKDEKGNPYVTSSLMVSSGYGDSLSSVEVILKHTESALVDLIEFTQKFEHPPKVFFSNRFNSGLFRVPWHKTEEIIKKVLKDRDIQWIVCDPRLGE